MNDRPPVAPELWQQVPPPVQSALLEAFARAEQRCQSLQEQLRQTQARLGHVVPFADFPSLTLDKPLTPSPIPPTQVTKPGHGRRLRRRRSPKGWVARWRRHVAERFPEYLFWTLLVVASGLVFWLVLQLINPGSLSVRW
jgi:hypothetical protein